MFIILLLLYIYFCDINKCSVCLYMQKDVIDIFNDTAALIMLKLWDVQGANIQISYRRVGHYYFFIVWNMKNILWLCFYCDFVLSRLLYLSKIIPY